MPADLTYFRAFDQRQASEWDIERAMCRNGGYVTVQGKRYGNGPFYHRKRFMSLTFPWFKWHIWSDLLVQCYAENREIGVMGPASSGKTYTTAAYDLSTVYIWPEETTILMSTTSKDMLDLRIWGRVKEIHAKAKALRPQLPGEFLESKYMLATSTRTEDGDDGRNLIDGIRGVACVIGGEFVGLKNYVGIKNKRVIITADEASLMERGFLDSLSNFRKNPHYQLKALGNPKDPTDALGTICEPATEEGGWDGLERLEKTRTWKTRLGGVAVQLCGWDTPNGEVSGDKAPFLGIITKKQIDADLAYYGRESMNFTMMNLGIMPTSGGVRRVITMTLCELNLAFEPVVWSPTPLKHYLGLDAAYSGTGGDRCVLTHLIEGQDLAGNWLLAFACPPIIVPVSGKKGTVPEREISDFVSAYAKPRNIPAGHFGYDSTGRGTLGVALSAAWSPEVIPLEFGGVPDERQVTADAPMTEREAYGKKVTALWFATRTLIDFKQLRNLPREVATEGCLREWGISKGTGKTDVEPKDKTKLRMGRSPDLWDSFAVAVEVARRNGFQFANAGATAERRKMPDWLVDMSRKERDLRRSHQLQATA